MYSAVLLAALATTTTTPNWHRGGCHGCYGGGNACYGCYGGAWTSGCYGYAGGYGYHGGCYGAYGAFYDPNHGGCTGCYGCYGGHSGYGIPVPAISIAPHGPTTGGPVIRDPYPPINPGPKAGTPGKGDPEDVAPPKEKKKEPEKKLSIDPNAPIRAQIRIEVPVGGKLFVDDRHIGVAAGTRTFQTPPLALGERYYYEIRIEVDRDGEIRSDRRRVIIEPGQDVAVSFPSLHSATAQAGR